LTHVKEQAPAHFYSVATLGFISMVFNLTREEPDMKFNYSVLAAGLFAAAALSFTGSV